MIKAMDRDRDMGMVTDIMVKATMAITVITAIMGTMGIMGNTARAGR